MNCRVTRQVAVMAAGAGADTPDKKSAMDRLVAEPPVATIQVCVSEGGILK
jgi:hypothetical protein